MSPSQQVVQRLDRSSSEQVALRSNVFRSTSRGPCDSRGREVNLKERCNSKHIHRHIGKSTPYIVKEIFATENQDDARENKLKQSVKVVKITPKQKDESVDPPLVHSATFGFTNHITKMILKYNTDARTAADTAAMLSEEIAKFAEQQRATLAKNRSSVRTRVTQQTQAHFQRNVEEAKKNKIEVKRIYRSIQEIVQHILEKGGESKHVRAVDNEEESTSHVTLEYIREKQRQVEESKSASDVMQLVRVFLNKKTEEFDALHKLYGDEFLVDPSLANELTSESKDNISVASDRMSRIGENLRVSEEDTKLNPYYDFNVLKKKWGVTTEEEVKDNIRRILTRQVLSTGERAKVKQEVEEQIIHKRLMQTDPRFAQKVANEKRKKAQSMHEQRKKEQQAEEEAKKQAQEQRSRDRSQSLKQRGFGNKPPSGQTNPQKVKQEKIRKEFFETKVNFGLAYGEVFERTKNFGELFQQKTQEYYKKVGAPNLNIHSSQDTFDTRQRSSLIPNA